MTTVTLFSHRVRGGMDLGFSLIHNSQDNLDLGWGINWRSNYDFRVVFSASKTNGRADSIVASYPDGKRVVFTRKPTPNGINSAVYLPPNGFYDVISDALSQIVLRTRDGHAYYFNRNNGYLYQIRDRAGNSITITRDVFHHLQTVTGPSGENITMGGQATGNPNLNILTVTSPENKVWKLNVKTFIDSITTAPGPTTMWVLRTITHPTVTGTTGAPTQQFYYNAYGAIVHETDLNGKGYAFAYDGSDRLTSFTYPVYKSTGSSTYLSYTYTYNGSSTVLTDPFGATSTDNYSGGLLVSQVDRAGYSTNYKYDNKYNVSQITDRRQNTSYYVYDNYGNCISSQDPKQYAAGVHCTYTYNGSNDLLTSTDTRGAVTTLSPNPTGKLLQVNDGLSNTLVVNTYNNDGALHTTSSQGVTTTVTYDGNGRVSSISRPDGSYQFGYSTNNVPLDRPVTVTDNRGRLTSFTYDEWDRLTSVLRSDNHSSSLALDAMGRVQSATDWLGHTTTFTYDNIGRLVGKSNARLDAESYTYRGLSMVETITNGKNETRVYTYWPREELKAIYLADGTSEGYQYDGNGNQTGWRNGLGQQTNYTYTNQDLLNTISYPAGAGVSFAYDNDGRRSSMTDSTGTTTWAYDNAERLITLSLPQGSISYGYDQWGRRTSMDEGNGNTTAYVYTADKLTSLTKSPEAETTTWGYDAYGRAQTQTYPNGATITYGYDGLDRVNSIVHARSNGTTLSSESYVYDAGGNLSTKTENGVTTTYGYDAIDQIVSEVKPGYNCAYTYDGNGNRLTKVLNGVTETYTYDRADKLKTRSGSAAGTFTYTTDWAGRTTQVVNGTNSTTLNYDYEDRVTRMTVNGVTSSYSYNGLDTRVSKTSSVGGNRTYKRDGASVTDPVLSDGTATMVPGISERRSGASKFLHTDYLGSTKGITDATQAVTDTMSYDAFGVVTSRTGSTPTQAGFAGGWGYQEDTESGLKLVGRRYYDPATGRFLAKDPAKDGRNWFVYCGNNPLKKVDPSGLKPTEIADGKNSEGIDTSSEFHDVQKEIELLRSEGKTGEAKELETMLLAGKIYVERDPAAMGTVVDKNGKAVGEAAAYVPWNGETIVLGPWGFNRLHAITNTKQDAALANANFQGMLIHELTHVHQRGSKLSHAEREIEACRATVKLAQEVQAYYRYNRGDGMTADEWGNVINWQSDYSTLNRGKLSNGG